MSLKEEYERLCKEPSDINEHLPTLYKYAKMCKHVTEFGVRHGVSTTALLYAQPEFVDCYDIADCRGVFDRLAPLTQETVFKFFWINVLQASIYPTDMLFIDTYHTYGQLKKELKMHAIKVKKYIIFHDTQLFGFVGENNEEGLLKAIFEFIEDTKEWRVKERHYNNNGLMVLERI